MASRCQPQGALTTREERRDLSSRAKPTVDLGRQRTEPIGRDHLQSIRGDLVGRLRGRRAEIEAAILLRVRDGVPDPVGPKDAEYLSGLRAAVPALVDYGLSGIEQGEEFSEPVPSAALTQAHRAARIGVSLGTVLLRYTAGYALLEGFVIEEAESGEFLGQGNVLRHVLGIFASILERLTCSIAQEYERELERAGRSLGRRRVEHVQRLLAGERVDLDALGYQLDAWHLGVIATGSEAQGALRALAAGVDRRLLAVPQGEEAVWAWLGGPRRLAVDDLERLPSVAAGTTAALAIGEPGQGLDGWRLTHKQAQAALLVALHRRGKPTRYAEHMLAAAALRDETLATSLKEMFLSPLAGLRDGGTAMRATLRAYVAAGCNTSSTGHALKVSRRTVETRLRAAEQLLGRSLRTCLAELEVALLIEELDAVSA